MLVVQVELQCLDGVVEALAAAVAAGCQERASHVFAGLGEAGQPGVHHWAQQARGYRLCQMNRSW